MHRLADRTRELLDELETSRPDLLSPVDLNRTLKQLLRNQVAILRALSGGGVDASSAQPRPVAATEPAPSAPQIRATPRMSSTSAPRPEAPAVNGNGRHHAFDADDDEHADSAVGHVSMSSTPAPSSSPVSVTPTPAASTAQASGPDGAATAEAAAPVVGAVAELFASVKTLPGMLARTLVEVFDNRDKDYSKGLDKLNRWVDGGAGTPFQLRGDRAFLNARAAGAPAMRNYEEQLMTRMGFSLRLGRLVVPGFTGDVIVYERPS